MAVDLLINLRPRPLPYPERVDPETAFRASRRAGFSDDVSSAFAAHALGVPIVDGENEPIHWSIEDVRRLRWTAWRLERAARIGR